MCTFFGKDIKRVNHLLKVYAFAQMIGKAQGLDDHTQQIVEAAAAVHDIGIKESERKYGSSAGKYQEQEGPQLAKELLASSDRKLYQIAKAVGYDNSKYFFRVFKKWEGMTPEQYRALKKS